MNEQRLQPNQICRYENENAGHRLRVRLVAPIPGRLWAVTVLDSRNGSRFPQHGRLTVHEHDLHAAN